ncbi:MAG: DUF72 domain-containing protein [Promethearchaeota archaeon]
MENNILIGTSGWGYDEWVGPFYPKSLKKEDFLVYYSEIFYTNEINTTFYHMPSDWMVKNWVTKTPNNFLFSVKLPKSITHESKLSLDHCSDDLFKFLKLMTPFIEAKKLLSLLIQLPPSFKKENHFDLLKDFIDNWPTNPEEEGYHLSIEFRHNSWMEDEVFNFLKKKQLVYCGVIEPLLPPRMDVTNNDFAYIRFHGYGEDPWFNYLFSDQEIQQWAQSILKVVPKVKKIGIYFNNHYSGYAVKNSIMMMKALGINPKNDPKDVSILDVKKKSGVYSKNQTSLNKFLT